MKTIDVVIGETYLCKVGKQLVPVVVTAKVEGYMRASGRREPDAFCIRRLGKNVNLPKQRRAAALRPLPRPVNLDLTVPTYDLQIPAILSTSTHISIVRRYPPPTITALPTDKLIADPSNPRPDIILQNNYLDACEHEVGWCIACKSFSLEDIKPNDGTPHTCPQCKRETVIGGEVALRLGYIQPAELGDE